MNPLGIIECPPRVPVRLWAGFRQSTITAASGECLMRINKSEALRGWRAPFHKNLPFPHGQAIALAAPHFLDHHAAGSIAIVVAGALANARHVTNREIQIREL